MPSSATITSFYVFSELNKAKSAEVNSNFSVWRGHIIPVSPSTSTAAQTKTYDLGSTEHCWNNLYSQSINLSQTSTIENIIQGESSGAISFKVDGVSKFKITDDGFIGINTATMTGYYNATAPSGHVALSKYINMTLSGSGQITNSTCTLVSTGKPILISMRTALNSGLGITASCVKLNHSTISAYNRNAELKFNVNGSLFGGSFFGTILDTTSAATFQNPPKLPVSVFSTIVFLTAGTHVFSLYGIVSINTSLIISNAQLYAREL